MKKLVMSLVLGASLAIVPSAFALKAMTADNMKDTTGQAGVSIAADDIIIYSSAGTTTYTDNKTSIETAYSIGYGDASIQIKEGTPTNPGTLTTIRAIFDNTTRSGYLKTNYYDILVGAGINNIDKEVNGLSNTKYTLAYNKALTGITMEADDTIDPANAAQLVTATGLVGRPITIDVSDELPILSAAYRFKLHGSATDTSSFDGGGSGTALGLASALATGVYDTAGIGTGVVGVRIGLPTVEIAKTGQTKTYSAHATNGISASLNSGRDYIQVTKTDSYTAILGGVIEIAPH